MFVSLLRKIGCCPFRKSYPNILMMQSGQDWDGGPGLEHLRELISEHKTQQGIPAVLSGWLRRIEQDCSKRSKPRQRSKRQIVRLRGAPCAALRV
jgi:hypothetical protein